MQSGGWKGLLEVVWSNPLLREGHLKPVAQGHVQMDALLVDKA